MATQYIHKKYFAVPHNANALTKMHVRQNNAEQFGSDAATENPAATKKYAMADFALFAVLPAALLGTFGGELLHRIFG